MKKLIILSIFILVGKQNLSAQEVLKLDIKNSKKEVIYLSKNNNEIEIIKTDKNNVLDSKKNINAKDNHVNIYLKWINPVKYRLTWKDTLLTDERDKAVTDFINLLTAQFGTQVTTLNQKESNKAAALTPPGKIIPREYKNVNLILWFLNITEHQTNIEKNVAEVDLLNSLSEKLAELENINAMDVTKKSSEIYNKIIALEDIDDYTREYPLMLKVVDTIEGSSKGFKKIEEVQKELSSELAKFTLSNKLLTQFTKSIISNYSETVTSNLTSNKKIITKLKPILEILKNSTKDESSAYKGYYKIRSVEFEDGKKLETTLTINEYEFNKETTEFSKKSEFLKKSLSFQKYDFFDVSVSTGLFFGNTTLKGFGVANDGNGDLKVTEDDINKNTAIAAVFLNFNFKTSRYFSPLVQIGIDPTKKRPFMLVGAGFTIPVAKLALSGGPIWTWNQKLEKLTVGESITSTTDLEEDIKYEFDVEPKGWYLGIQYNF